MSEKRYEYSDGNRGPLIYDNDGVDDYYFLNNSKEMDKFIELLNDEEEYWKEKLGENAIIEQVGAMATIVVEKFEKENLLEKMPVDIAKLLMAAILDNTLNLKSYVTTKRDIESYNKLQQIVQDENFAKDYFMECQQVIDKDLSEAIRNDIKIEDIDYSLPRVVGQLVLWDKTLLWKNKEIIKKVLNEKGDKWVMNVICLKEGKNYIMASDKEEMQNLEELLETKANDEIIELNRLMLRKELRKKAIEKMS